MIATAEVETGMPAEIPSFCFESTSTQGIFLFLQIMGRCATISFGVLKYLCNV